LNNNIPTLSVYPPVLKSRVNDQWSNKTIGETNDLLDRLVQASDADERDAIFRSHIFNNYSALEQKWLMRVIIGDMKLGVKHDGFLKYLGADAALDYYSSCCDLRKTCFAMTNPGQMQQRTSRLSVGQPFTPMLAKGYQGAGAGGQLEKCEASMKKKMFVMDM
jgi:DNA ligase 4